MGLFDKMLQNQEQKTAEKDKIVSPAEVPGNVQEKEQAALPHESKEEIQQGTPAPAAQASGGGTAQRALSDAERITEAEKFRNREETRPVDHPAGYQNPVGGYKPPEKPGDTETGITHLDSMTLARQEDLLTVVQKLAKQVTDLSVRLAPVLRPAKVQCGPEIYTRAFCDEKNTSEIRKQRIVILNNTLGNLEALNKLSLELSSISDTLDI